MAGYGYEAVGPREGCCTLFSRFFMVVFCMLAALMVAAAVMLHLAPREMHDARGWAATHYENHLQPHMNALGQHAEPAAGWVHGQYKQHLQGHFDAAGRWVADAYQQHAQQHVTAAGNWAHGVYQQHLQQQIDPARQWASDAYHQHLAPHVNNVHRYFAGHSPGHDQILTPYDCSGNLKSWSNAHKEWCCEHHDTGCTTTAAPPKKHYMWISVPVHPGKYDCAAGIKNWKKGKKKWCCSNKGIGCEEAIGDDFDCMAGTGNSEIGWSNRKKLWCCLHENRGCPEQVPDVFDCESGYQNWPESWSVSKKEWCCDHHHRGCHGQEMESYDCRKDLEDWHGLWTGPKKAFCCKTYALGCPTHDPAVEEPVREEVHVVDVPPAPAPVTVVHHVHHYTTVSEPEVEPAAAPYDCDAGYANWRNGWSEHKKGWCCAHQSVGCSYQCQEGAMTSFHEKAWCCWHLNIGCDGAELQQSYDCSAGFANWRAGWSEGKKLWCCQHYSQGCA